MALRYFKAENFRCLKSICLAAPPRYNLITGPNAAGKTSVLEAIGYLGRGKSFRNAGAQELVRFGCPEFLLLGKIDSGGRVTTVGVRNGNDGLEVKIDGAQETSAATLAEILPLQVIDPEIHELVAGGPEQRRRYLDWIAFHVERGYAEHWRRFRRALRQRNAALREGSSGAEIAVWDREFLAAATEVDNSRRRVLDSSREALERNAAALLGSAAGFEYRQGWAADQDLEQALAAARDRDRTTGATQAGPQRADLKLIYHQRQAKRLVSRGQQKLLACTMILAASEVVQRALAQPLLLLLDDPAAELDAGSLERLLNAVFGLDCQIIATALDAGMLRFPEPPAMFHVEQGELREIG